MVCFKLRKKFFFKMVLFLFDFMFIPISFQTQASVPNEQFSDLSIYNLKSDWINDKEEKIQLKKFLGKPLVVGMVYTSCAYSCPLIISKMQGIEKKLPKNNSVAFLVVSFDPKRDTPQHMRIYREKRKITSPNWYFLTSSDDKVREFAEILNVKYKQLDNGEFSHSNIISVLNKKGELVYQMQGMGEDLEKIIKTLQEAS